MSLPEKMIIPFLDEELTVYDLYNTPGFEGLYLHDINRPYLDNHVFLLFSFDSLSSASIDRWSKLKKMKCVYATRTVKIKGKLYDIFTFPIMNNQIRNILKGNFVLSDKDKLRIFKFWNFTDDDVNKYMLTGSIPISFEEKTIPEEDLSPNEKSQVLSC